MQISVGKSYRRRKDDYRVYVTAIFTYNNTEMVVVKLPSTGDHDRWDVLTMAGLRSMVTHDRKVNAINTVSGQIHRNVRFDDPAFEDKVRTALEKDGEFVDGPFLYVYEWTREKT